MPFVQIPSTALRVGMPVPFPLRDSNGLTLVPRGGTVSSEEMLQQLTERGVFVDADDAEALKRAMVGKVTHMVHQGALLGRIAGTTEAEAIGSTGPWVSSKTTASSAHVDWSSLTVKLGSLLRDPNPADFVQRVVRIDQDMLALQDADTDHALLTLIQTTAGDTHKYSITHAMLVTVVADLAARRLQAWPVAWRTSLRRAALTMNLAMTVLQDQLALQETPPTSAQRALIDEHGKRGAEQMRAWGVDDTLWLQAVEHHHATLPGPLADRPPMLQLARLIQRADIFAARLSPRKLRPAMSATAAAKAAYLDENQQPDEAGAAIIKALGIYPPGSLVRLASTEIGVVLRRGRQANEPVVGSFVSRNGTPLAEPALRDTRLKAHEVTGGLAPHDVKVRYNLERLARLL